MLAQITKLRRTEQEKKARKNVSAENCAMNKIKVEGEGGGCRKKVVFHINNNYDQIIT